MSVLARAKTHFKERLGEELQSLDVPEWPDENGESTKIYYRSSMSLKQKSICLKWFASDEKDSYAKGIAYQIIFRCRDSEGNRIFKENQLDQILDEIDPDILADIIKRMDEALAISNDEIAGN